MANFSDHLEPKHIEFIKKQKLFFTATAPNEGRINLSPKGLNSFRVLSSSQVGYLDLTGSGNETAAHLYENGRMTLMFCSFDKQPLILRLYGTGMVAPKGSTLWNDLEPQFDILPGARQIIVVNVTSVQTSCGFGIPLYEYIGERKTLTDWAEKKQDGELDKVAAYWEKNNRKSIDGLPTRIEQNQGFPG